MASIDYMCDVGYAAPPKSVQPVRQATSVVCLFLCYQPPEGGKYRKEEILWQKIWLLQEIIRARV